MYYFCSMKIRTIGLLVLVIAFVLGACDPAEEISEKEELPEIKLPKIELRNFSSTGCKGYLDHTRSDTIKDVFEYSCIHDGYLYVTHRDVLFGCCPDALLGNIHVYGNHIVISESEIGDSCNCICPYDLSYEIGPLVEGETYILLIGHGGYEMPIAEFEFHNSMSGVWEFNHSLYAVARQSADAPLQYKAEMPLFTLENIKSYNVLRNELMLENVTFDSHLFSDTDCQYRVYFYDGDELLFDAYAISSYSNVAYFSDIRFFCNNVGSGDTFDVSGIPFYIYYSHSEDESDWTVKGKKLLGLESFNCILRKAGKIIDSTNFYK